LVNYGEAVGILAAQSIGEPGAQLTMRTFHIGGATTTSVEKSLIESAFDGSIKLHNIRTVQNRHGHTIVVSNNSELIIVDSANREQARYKVPSSARLLVNEGEVITKGTKIATWDPYNNYIVCEYAGLAKFEDIVFGVSYKEKLDEDLGKSHKIICDWTGVAKSLNPRVSVINKSGDYINIASGSHAKYILPVDAILSVVDGEEIMPGDYIARIPRESSQSARDITGGLPRVEDIFEARVPKEPAIISEIDGVAEFTDDYKTKNHLLIRATDGSDREVSYNIPRGKHVRVQHGAVVNKGEIIIDGDLDPHDILLVSGIEALAQFIVDEVQQVYKLQGVKIDNKHIEIIIKYMLQKAEIVVPGDLPFVAGQQVDLTKLYTLNNLAVSEGKKSAEYRSVLQGITRASIQTESFISAASFQETTRVLVEAAISGKKDYLRGMKENVILGRLIKAGTGFVMGRMREQAAALDKEEAVLPTNNSVKAEEMSGKKSLESAVSDMISQDNSFFDEFSSESAE
jgi:DNA-directed RNA polymerase subunit beta'